jgi:hypothetical protein
MQAGKGVVFCILAALAATPGFAAAQAAGNSAELSAQWTNVQRVSDTMPTTQILAQAFKFRSGPLHDRLFRALRNLHTNDTRLQLWISVTRAALPEFKSLLYELAIRFTDPGLNVWWFPAARTPTKCDVVSHADSLLV